MRAAVACSLAAIAICSSGCASRAERVGGALSGIRENLSLSVTAPAIVAVGEETELQFRVRNSGRQTIAACVGRSHNYWLEPEDDTQGNEPIGIATERVEPPGCRQRFRLAPGAHIDWQDTTRVPGIVRGFASLTVDVQIVDPKHCDRLSGCPDVMLTARAPVEIR